MTKDLYENNLYENIDRLLSRMKYFKYKLQIEIDLGKRKIKLPKLGLVEIRGYRNLESIEGKIISGTVLREKTGKYYVSIIVEEEKEVKEKKEPNSIVGIDLGVKNLVVTSDGKKYTNSNLFSKTVKELI